MITAQINAATLPADQGVASSTALVGINSLTFPVAANSSYMFSAFIPFALTAILGGCKFDVSAPAAPNSLTYSIKTVNSVGFSLAGAAVSGPLDTVLPNVGSHFCEIFGTLENGVNAGNLTIMFAQHASNANAITVKRGASFSVIQTL